MRAPQHASVPALALFWTLLLVAPLTPPIGIWLLNYLYTGGVSKESGLQFILGMLLVGTAILGTFVVAPLLAITAFVLLLVGGTQRIKRLLLIASSLLLTALTLVGSIYWFLHFKPW
jgi:hypothetical protein